VDLPDGQHVMATGNMHGDIALWDLEKRTLVHVMKGAHDASISSLQFLNSQPILVSSGSDNAVKVRKIHLNLHCEHNP
jgi:U3 small nucleolar RNA-associated protein 21